MAFFWTWLLPLSPLPLSLVRSQLSPNGDYVLSPAYDLLNTKIHVDDSDFALDDGLFSDDFQSEEKKKSNHVGLEDFQELAKRFEINEKRRNKILTPFLQTQAMVEELTNRSFLNDKTKRAYLLHYQTKRNQLNKI